MPRNASSDTIAAVASARGTGGIGIIRLSGPEALKILRAVFRRGGGSLTEFTPRRLEYGWVLDAFGQALDEVMAVYLPGPHSFSGEDTAEIHCHGGLALVEAVLESVLRRGARPAGPGEFTRRAFLNGRLDLSQAEAVAEIISAPTLQGIHLARNKLEGFLGARLEELRLKLESLRARLCLALDFPEESVSPEEELEEQRAFREALEEIRSCLRGLVQSCEQARLWREGARVVLAGEVNTGKSSLFNALLGRPRALVSDLPGTTRDFIEESLNLRGMPVRLSDTAGLRPAPESEDRPLPDEVEKAGLELTAELCRQADLILLVLEARPLPPSRDPPALLSALGIPSVLPLPPAILLARNKADLFPEKNPPEEISGFPCLSVSARTGQGTDKLRSLLYELLSKRAGSLDFEQAAPPSIRQKIIISGVLEELDALALDYGQGIPAEILSSRLESAAESLAEIIGMSCREEVLDQVFSKFCVGK
ncbi:MAG: tRNA uridine-5-carboxymethylaminomethyl(34) synthesis GTPase MnmE [Deltaproteobacteria bacterium]|jgi:tRNA modification GTPase|nr:tRNA uridine-5-carboxymethylaminomethyl(34) synthesis GTPase MnmE [Deltaproteobacteria bacterium]